MNVAGEEWRGYNWWSLGDLAGFITLLLPKGPRRRCLTAVAAPDRQRDARGGRCLPFLVVDVADRRKRT